MTNKNSADIQPLTQNNTTGRFEERIQKHHDRRRYARVTYRLKARFLTEDGQERPCVVVNISAGGAMVRAKQTPKINEKVVLYIDGVGRFESVVTRAGRHAFAVAYSSRRSKTQRTADALIRVLNRGQSGPDRRNTPRIELDRSITVTHKDGSQIEGSIIDISLTGASVKIDPAPPLGAEIIVGRMKARVVRHHEFGVGVVFVGPAQKMEDIIKDTVGELTSETENGTKIADSFGRKAT